MEIRLDGNVRKYINVNVSVGERVIPFKYYERNTRQIREVKEKSIEDGVTLKDLDLLNLKHFDENFFGEEQDKRLVKVFYEENGNFYDFISALDEELLRA